MIAMMIVVSGALLRDHEVVLSITRQSGTHRYTVRQVTGQFRPHGRDLVWARLEPKKDGFLPGYRVGSKTWIFGYGYEPVGYPRADIAHRSVLKELEKHTEIRSLSVTVDGQRWDVKQDLIRDLLDPHTLDTFTIVPRDAIKWGIAKWVNWTTLRTFAFIV